MARDDNPPPAKRPHADCTGTSSIDGEPPLAKRSRADCTSTSIHSFHPDQLREIFLRLDSLSDLVRAACTCREWRKAAASSPPFRRQFIKRHPAPLLGLFFDPPSPDVPAIPSFAPARGTDPMLVAALLRGDFLLTNLQRRPLSVEPSWFVLDARGGYLLLMNWDEGLLALLNPLAPPHQRFFDVDDIRIFDDHHIGDRQILRAGVIFHDENPERFGIFCLASQGEFRLRAAVFSSDLGIDGGWILSSWLVVPPHPHPDPEIPGGWLESGMRAGNFIYWPYRNRQHVVVLDPTDPNIPRLFVEMIIFPAGMDLDDFGSYTIGETHGGTMSIAYTDVFNIVLMVRGEDGRDAGTWTNVREFDLADELFELLGQFPDGLELVAMRGSIVYFTTSQMYHPSQNPCWFGSLCLETGKGEWLFARAYDAFFQPYHHLSWTSFLEECWQPFVADKFSVTSVGKLGRYKLTRCGLYQSRVGPCGYRIPFSL
uniref:Uncharacterized protein n=1 Tax=Avena sativa TaxID=4498 RepID=A0ACD5VX12_AVESA